MENAVEAFRNIKDLEVDELFVPWEHICFLAPKFSVLSSLTASSNAFQFISSPLLSNTLTSLTLEYNQFTSLSDLLPLTSLVSLEALHLKGNRISRAHTPPSIFSQSLRYVDLSYNQVTSWAFVDSLTEIFPGMTALRFAHNPIYDDLATETGTAASVDDGYMLTLARLRNLKSLNFSSITEEERRNAEMFYLSRIGQAMAKVPKNEEDFVTAQHKRYAELCQIYGEPSVIRKSTNAINPNFLEARLIKFTFYIPPNPDANEKHRSGTTHTKEIPKGFDIYQVKGIVGRLFGIRPLGLRLIWETGEWDPVAGYEDEGDNSDDEKDDGLETTSREKGNWMKRELEIEDSTRQVGFCVDGIEATVRVELK